MAKLFANSGDPDQTPRSAASDLGLHCLLITLLRVSRLQWVNSVVPSLGQIFRFINGSCISMTLTGSIPDGFPVLAIAFHFVFLEHG